MILNPEYQPFESLAGKLLLSHPRMTHDAFRGAVLLIVQHERNGAVGAILNRPLNKVLSEIAPGFAEPPLGALPLYEGGPMERGNIAFCGWIRDENSGTYSYQYGLSKEDAASICENCPQASMRAFLGNAQWSPGQLESELDKRVWFAVKADMEIINCTEGAMQWEALLEQKSPFLRLLAEAPADLSAN